MYYSSLLLPPSCAMYYYSYAMHGGKMVLISACVCVLLSGRQVMRGTSVPLGTLQMTFRTGKQSCRGCHPLALVMRKLLPVPKEDLHQCFPQWELRYAIVKCASAEIRSQQQ